MAQKKVSELNTTSNVGLSDLFLLTQNLGQSEYDSLALTASDLATWLANSMSFPLLMPYTTATTLIGAINEIAQSGGGGGGGGSTVYLGTSAPSSATGSNADLYVQYTAGSPAVVDALYVKISGAWTEIDTGASTLSALTDTAVSSPSNGQVLKYNSTSGKWENANESGGGGSADVFIIHGDSTLMGTVESAADILDAIANGMMMLYAPYAPTSNKELYVCSEVDYSETSGDISTAFLSFSQLSSRYAPESWTIETIFVTVMASPASVITSEYEISTRDLNVGITQHTTLTAGSTSVSFTISDEPPETSNIDIYTSVYGLNPTAVTPTIVSHKITGLTLTFEAQQSDVEVSIRITKPFY